MSLVTRRSIIVIAVILVVMLAALWLGQRRLIYFPDRAAPRPDGRFGDVVLNTSDGLRLRAWLIRPVRSGRGIAVLVIPGNAGHRGDRALLATALADRGFTVLLTEYRGYGGNPGSPSEGGLIRDARGALAYLIGQGFGAERIVYFGESLGAAVAARLASEHAPAALVLRSPFTDLASIGSHHYPWLPVRAILRDRYPVADLVAQVTAPTTVVFGSADAIVPPAQSRAVAARSAGRARLVEVERAGHNNPELAHGDAVITAVVEAAER